MSVLDLIAKDLLLDASLIESIVQRGGANYRRIKIENKRTVWEPILQLKLLQYWIVDFLKKYGSKPRDNATAYEEGSSIVSNAYRHRFSNHILKLDLRHFFPSIDAELLEQYLNNHVSYAFSRSDLDLIWKIVMFRDGLVMGAPSSPYIANRVMIPIDAEIEKQAKAMDSQMIYTRYCDDLFFSSKEFIDKSFIDEIKGTLNYFGFDLNTKKTRFMGRGSNKWMAGVAVNSKRKISLGQRRKRELRGLLYKFAINESPSVEDAQKLQGFIAFVKQVEPKYVDRMLVKYASYGEGSIVKKIHDVLSI